ncbi:MAG TPA: 23S rRNA (guanosine(2251)-2'-O)-methyltransferase RlmB [Terriglobia bacterium]|nr:23S rRNA (guanosine(2251)-2'-O)-methyltransferase RlmB [Terriglobia bacterium]
MSQRKKKSGKPGTPSRRDRQDTDRTGQFPQKAKSRGGGPGTRQGASGERRGSLATTAERGADRGAERPRSRQNLAPDQRDSRSTRYDGGYRTESPRRDASGDDFPRNRAPRDRDPQRGTGPYWLFGQHPVTEAIRNPLRKIQRLVRTTGAEGEALDTRSAERPLPPWEPIERHQLEQLLPEGAVHQGIAARVAPLEEPDLLDICDQAQGREEAVVVILDQVTDPHNVGAILRSAAAFGALAVILTERHAAPESGTLAKSASGALEHVPLVRVGNLARAMEQLKEAGFWLAGLAAEGKTSLAGAKLSGKVGLVMGAEGPGLRRLTRDHCDLLVRLPTGGAISHLNVSNAAAVALYELARLRT